MPNLILILPGAAGHPETPSVLRAPRPGFSRLAEQGEVIRLAPLEGSLPEAAYLGIEGLRMAPGPLTVAAFGVDPPSPSLQFHLSVLSQGSPLNGTLPPEDRQSLIEAIRRLETRRLKLVQGDTFDHGLVLEGDGEVECVSPKGLNDWRTQLPQGDFEKPLRLFIDDSVNLLCELELNRRRTDEGLPPINLLWPWGAGPRLAVPNLGLTHGQVGHVFSSRIRLAGLTRLAGWRHGDRGAFGEGTAIQLKRLLSEAKKHSLAIFLFDSTWTFRREDRLEELDWLLSEIDREFLVPMLEQEQAPAITVLCPGPHGLALRPSPAPTRVPFDERAFEEALASLTIAEAVRGAIGVNS